MKRYRAWFGVLLIFLFGAVCGAAISTSVIHQWTRALLTGGSAKMEDPVVSKLRHELHLDPAQNVQVKQIVLETRAQLEMIKQKTQPETHAALLGGEDKVRHLLRPDQAARFEKMLREGHENWRFGR